MLKSNYFRATARATPPLAIVLSLLAVGLAMIDDEVILFKPLDVPLFLLIVVGVAVLGVVSAGVEDPVSIVDAACLDLEQKTNPILPFAFEVTGSELLFIQGM